MPRAPFPQELYNWLYKHVEAGDIDPQTANKLWSIARKDFPGDPDFIGTNRHGRPGSPGLIFDIPELDAVHSFVYGREIIKKYIVENPPPTPKHLARFATTLLDAGCWGMGYRDKYPPIKSMYEDLTRIFEDIGIKPMRYNSFAQALKDIRDEEGSFPREVRERDANRFQAYMAKEVQEVLKIKIWDD